MVKLKIARIRKRDGSMVPFDTAKIEQAIYKALLATKSGNKELAQAEPRTQVRVNYK
ncbi:MAG: ATP cone domain-containing protein [Chloroflexota bacterium]